MAGDNFCPAPWTSIYIDSDGHVDNCCISHNDLGNIKDQDLGEIIHGTYHKEIKRGIVKDRLPEGCAACVVQPDQSLTLRQYLIDLIGRGHEELYQSEDNFKLKYLDLRWRNTCNFACVSCSPTFSSQWAKELKQFPIMTNKDHSHLNKFLMDNLDDLEHLYLAGGEPLLIVENLPMLEKIYSINPAVKIVINSNLSIIDGNRIFDILRKFPNVKWIVSCESVGERYNYIRYGGDWENFKRNLKTVMDIWGYEVKFNMVYHALNTQDIFNCVDYLASQGIERAFVNFTYYNIATGGPLDPRNLDPRNLDLAKQTLQHNLDTLPGHENVFKQHLSNTLNTLNKEYDNSGHTSLMDFLADIDQRRNLDSRTIFPELYNI